MANQQVLTLFLKAVMAAKKSLALYPASSPLATEWVQRLHRSLQGFMQEGLGFPIVVGSDRFVCEGEEVLTLDPVLDVFRFELASRGIAEFSIDPAVEERELQEFLDLLNQSPADLETLEGAVHYLRNRHVVHITVTGPSAGKREQEGDQAAPMADEGRDDLDRLVEAVLELTDQRFAELVYDRAALGAWFRAIADDRRADGLPVAVKMLGGMAERAGDREVRLRTMVETLLQLPDWILRPFLIQWFLPSAAHDLTAFNLLIQVTEDEMGQIARLVPQDRIMALASELMEYPWEAGKRQRLIESLTATVERRGAPEPELTALPALSRDDPLLVELRREFAEACQPDGLLDRSMQILLAVLLHVENDEYPGFALDALEEMMGEALARGRIDLSLNALSSLVASKDMGREWMREHPRRMSTVLRHLGGRAHVSLAVGVIRGEVGAEQLGHAAEYIRLLGRDAVLEFTTLLAEEKSRRVRARMCQVLARVGPPIIPVLLPWLDDTRWYVVRNVVHTLGKIRHDSAFVPVVGLIDHEHPRVRMEVVRTVGLIGGRTAVGPLIRGLADPDLEVRSAVVKVLGSLRDDSAVPALRRLLDGPGAESPEDLVIKQEAVNALAAIGTRVASQVLSELASRRVWFWKRAEKRVREMAAGALRAARPPDLGPDWSGTDAG